MADKNKVYHQRAQEGYLKQYKAEDGFELSQEERIYNSYVKIVTGIMNMANYVNTGVKSLFNKPKT